jgi:Polysaccharide pyruvyl transferase
LTRILLRAKKSPFDVLSPEESLARNIIGTNSGNLIFIESAYKLLSARGTEIDVQGRLPDPREADRINASYDAYVVPLANAFRPEFEFHLSKMTRLVERLRIPVVVLGVGIQADTQASRDRLAPIERTVKAFVSAVLDRSASIGVRGEFTEAYLQALGFRDVEVIGCPSMFRYGPNLRVEKRRARLEPDARIAINATPRVPVMAELVRHHAMRYPNLEYIAQDIDVLALLVWGDEPSAGAGPSELDASRDLVAEDRVRLFVDPTPWIAHLRSVDFAFGTRIHGNIAALLAGTPAYVVAHDSRSLELARYFAIPHRLISDVGEDADAAAFHDESDFTELNRGHLARFERLIDFLRQNGLQHIYAEGQDPDALDARLAATPFPAAVQFGTRPSRRSPRRLAEWAAYRLRRSLSTARRELRGRAGASSREPAGGP